ncbi:hypothetical protein PVAP13_9NG111073 [Panicum virgatum]|uniref:Uncharacterized protein n=1 Tax=Panicum virgatum TaxID=38727 RepID=A0A8T0MDQ2_PANVG|nr:hypothetical protein PVAP13_9NG111073 [Panicum virgatum]
MNWVTFLIFGTKPKKPREGHIINAILYSLSGLIESEPVCIIVQRRVKLCKDFGVPIVPETHDVIKSKFLAYLHGGIVVLRPLEHNCHIEIMVKLTPKMSLKALTLLQSIDILLSSVPQCHFFPTVVSWHLNSKTFYMLWVSKSGITFIPSLIRNVMSDTSPLRIGPGWRRIGPTLQDVRSTARLMSWRYLTAAAHGFLAGATTRTQLTLRRARR